MKISWKCEANECVTCNKKWIFQQLRPGLSHRAPIISSSGSLNASLHFLFTESRPSKVFVIAWEICAQEGRRGAGLSGAGCLSSGLLGYTCLGQGWLRFFSERTPLQMCGGSRVAAMYSKSASEGSSICGAERRRAVRPGRGEKRKFALPSSQETLEEAVWMGGELQRRGKWGGEGPGESGGVRRVTATATACCSTGRASGSHNGFPRAVFLLMKTRMWK